VFEIFPQLKSHVLNICSSTIMPQPMPQIDQDACSGWSENDTALYNAYSFFLAKTQVERRKTWPTFGKFTKKKPWTRNHGPIMRGVRKNPSPIVRQQVNPRPLTDLTPLVDTINLTETKRDAILYWQDFQTPALSWLPSFNDFLDHVTEFGTDMMEKIELYEEQFLRTMMFHMSPFMFIAGENQMTLVNTTPFQGTTVLGANDGKSAAVMAGLIAQYGGEMSHLTMRALAHGLTQLSVNLGIVPFAGTGLPAGDNKALDQKYCLVTGEEAWTQFSFDPYLQNYKNCNLDVVNGSFQGNLFGRMTSKLESLPMHFKTAGTQASPETRVENDANYNQGETLPNPDYTSIATSPYAISWFMGDIGYDQIEVGPPPAAFTGNKAPHNFPAMQWNGEVYLTKQFLLECVDPATGLTRYQQNSKGRWLRYEGSATMGIFPRQPRNVIPILHKRKQLV
jgi:hypothetical protein